MDEVFDRFEKVGEFFATRYDAVGRLVRLNVKEISTYVLENGTYVN
jgi:hypothetical protein